MAWAALPVAGILLLAGCGDDDKKDDKGNTPATTAPATSGAPTSKAPSSAPPSSGAPAADPATFSADQKAAAEAYTKLFDAKTPVAERKALINDADSIAPLIDSLLQNPLLGTAALKVNDVKVDGDKAAVSFDVLLSGAPAYPAQTGEAVKVDGKWKVSKSVICKFGQGLGAQLPPACSA